MYTAAGRPGQRYVGTYLHCVTGQIPIKFILKYWRDNPTVGVRPGDIFYCNEAIYGGIHNPDQFAIMPIFHGGELVAWSVVGAHQSETGGKEPGGEVTTARTRHDEGMKLIPIKIGERYMLRDDLLKMMENFISRAPRMQVTDVRRGWRAADRVRVRVEELASGRGTRFLRGLFRKMIAETAEGATGADPRLERRGLPARRVPRHHRLRRRADQDAGGADQARATTYYRPHGCLARA